MSIPTHYDALIIGSGQAGTPLASAFAKAGQKTALVERTHIAGCCVNEGCTPTKTMIASGRVAHITRRGPDYGIYTRANGPGDSEVSVDMQKVRDRKREIVKSFRGGSERRLHDAGAEILIGEASFVDGKTVKIKLNAGGEKIITAEKIFINTGERPAPAELEGIEKIDSQRVLDSTSVQELSEVPAHLVVIGGGYVGVEFGQLMKRLGSKVTIIQRGKQLLPREDAEIATSLQDILKEDGIDIFLESTALSIAPSPSGLDLQVCTRTEGQETNESISASHILFAAGRLPNTESLNLPAAAIATNPKGYIVSNSFLETSAPNIYAMGDVKGPPAFTHISYDDFRIIQHNLISFPSTSNTNKLSTANRQNQIPYVVYTDPQLGHIGLHEHEARAQFPGDQIKVAKMPMSYVARALETDESRGLMKAVINANSGLILGFTCLGIEGGEIMSVVQMAIMGGTRWEVLRDAVWAHPSLAESLNNIWGFLD